MAFASKIRFKLSYHDEIETTRVSSKIFDRLVQSGDKKEQPLRIERPNTNESLTSFQSTPLKRILDNSISLEQVAKGHEGVDYDSVLRPEVFNLKTDSKAR